MTDDLLALLGMQSHHQISAAAGKHKQGPWPRVRQTFQLLLDGQSNVDSLQNTMSVRHVVCGLNHMHSTPCPCCHGPQQPKIPPPPKKKRDKIGLGVQYRYLACKSPSPAAATGTVPATLHHLSHRHPADSPPATRSGCIAATRSPLLPPTPGCNLFPDRPDGSSVAISEKGTRASSLGVLILTHANERNRPQTTLLLLPWDVWWAVSGRTQRPHAPRAPLTGGWLWTSHWAAAAARYSRAKGVGWRMPGAHSTTSCFFSRPHTEYAASPALYGRRICKGRCTSSKFTCSLLEPTPARVARQPFAS